MVPDCAVFPVAFQKFNADDENLSPSRSLAPSRDLVSHWDYGIPFLGTVVANIPSQRRDLLYMETPGVLIDTTCLPVKAGVRTPGLEDAHHPDEGFYSFENICP